MPSALFPLTIANLEYIIPPHAEVVEMVDALDSGSSGVNAPWGFKSPLRQ